LGTAAFRRSSSSRDRGPGMSVTTRRSCVRSIQYLPSAARGAANQFLRGNDSGPYPVSVAAAGAMRQGPAETPGGALLYAPAQLFQGIAGNVGGGPASSDIG